MIATESDKRLYIRNYKKIEGNRFGPYKIQSVREEPYRYVFTIENVITSGTYDIIIHRNGSYDTEEGKTFFQINNEARYVSAEYFTMYNALKTFSEILGK
jgi:hypothetical protein